MTTQGRVLTLAFAAATVGLAGCQHYVTHEEFDQTVGELRQSDTRLAKDLFTAKTEMASVRGDLEAKFEQQDAKFQKYDAVVAESRNRVSVDLDTHFDYASAALRDDDKRALDDFASVIHSRHPDVLITAEGFTDAHGSPELNKELGLSRAKAVRAYLIQNGGIAADHIRAVSYGEARNRQVVKGGYGKKGEANRRVALVVDYAPPASTGYNSAASGQTYGQGLANR